MRVLEKVTIWREYKISDCEEDNLKSYLKEHNELPVNLPYNSSDFLLETEESLQTFELYNDNDNLIYANKTPNTNNE